MTPEGKAKAAIKDYLCNAGAYYFMPVQTGYGARTLDFLTCVPLLIQPWHVGRTIGAFVSIEAKRPGRANPSPLQKVTIENIQTAGGLAFVATSAEDVEHGLRGLLAGG